MINLFLNGGIRSWMCSDALDLTTIDGVPYCLEQKDNIKSLYSIMSGCELVGSMVAGLLMDYIGPQITAGFGIAMQVLAIVLYIMDSADTPTLAAGMVIGGLAINCVANPSFVLSWDFPNNASLCASLTIAAQSLASGVLPVLGAVWGMTNMSFAGIWLSYMICIIPVGLLYIAALPSSTTKAMDEDPPKPSRIDVRAEEDVELISPSPAPNNENTQPSRRRSSNAIDAFQKADSVEDALNQMGEECHEALQAIISPEYIVLNLINLGALVMVAFFNLNTDDLLGPKAARFVATWMPLQAVYALLWGAICDVTTTPPIMLLHFAAYALIYLLTLVTSPVVQYLTANLFLMFLPFTYAMKYTQMIATWPSHIHGVLFGVCGAVSGSMAGILTLMSKMGHPTSLARILPFVSIAHFLPVAWLWMRSAKAAKVA
ncbi:major facilitator family transporter [Gregarina niphandrodes]|uniref:Major facilitator family transporter n=1 Tax=Gregarina niphandrodes TaxID=110365 RepID=A0A023B4G0_GRENI|nr:major facilitator family transporter [Gregarina niphandrodes]EZG56714.1 major facilitator family transporter [Gregarina niphandrodes]|eukprot:XP_011131182.1 major facilitator family transporter [Gregarina niphandrodes]